tara:strand:- start:522 stop:671 length:150 start_codon:yes stop_codon:yes gene_type:complete
LNSSLCFSSEDVDVQPLVLNLKIAHQQFDLVAIAGLNITLEVVQKIVCE